MIIGLVTTAPSQWKKLSTSGPLTPGKRYLLSAGETDDLVRKHRTDDDDLIVLEQPPVDAHLHVEREPAAGELFDFRRRDCAQRR